jgi:hypothetical protein
MNLYLDIETLPDPKFKEDIRVSPPGNMSKPETFQKWKEECEQAAIDAEFKKLGLDGTRGQIFCIAWAIDDEPVESVTAQQSSEPSTLDERAMLNSFLLSLKEGFYSTPGRPETIKWVGHYITGFDLRFIWQRCVVNKVRPSITIPYDAKPWSDNVFDTCSQWKGSSSSSGSMDAICKAFGIQGKGDMDGSKVYDEYLAGNYQKIIDYCKNDVERVRQIHKRMTFQC